METTLNLVWLAVTVIAICVWRFRWIGSRQVPRHSTKTEAVAMVCVLALLFPVISLTDDLHPETVAVDAASGKRNACLIAAIAPQLGSSTANPAPHSTMGQTPRLLTLTTLIASELPSAPNRNNPRDLPDRSAGRSPPSSL